MPHRSRLAAGRRHLACLVVWFAWSACFAYAAHARGNLFLSTPCRLFDTRSTPGVPPFDSGQTRLVQVTGACGVPAGAKAVIGNLTATNTNAHGHVTVFAGGDSVPTATALTFQPGDTVAANVIAPLGASGAVGIVTVLAGTTPRTDLIFDVVGYVSSDDTAPNASVVGPLGYQPVPTCRLADTVHEGGPLVAGEDRAFGVTGRCDLPVGAVAAALNLTAVAGSAGGHLAAHAGGTAVGPTTTLNFPAAKNVANGLVSRLGTQLGGDLRIKHVSVAPSGVVRAVLDAHGFFSRDARAHYSPVRPCRVFDTRTTNAPFLGGERRRLDAIRDCTLLNPRVTHRAAFVTLTVTSPSTNGHFTVARTQDALRSAASVINVTAGEPAISNGLIVELDAGGNFDLLASLTSHSATAHVVVDVYGYFSATDAGQDTEEPSLPGNSTAGGSGLALADGIHPALERGFDPAKAYDSSGLDTVNLFNGNLTVNLPIGGSYPMNSGLAYGFNLGYNSKLFDHRLHMYSVGGATGHWLTATSTVPNRLSNAGVGWVLSLGGRLLSPDDEENNSGGPIKNGRREPPFPRWVYVSPDGAQHVFYERLNYHGDTAGGAASFTRDGSYLRMSEISPSVRTVDFPDGRRFAFRHLDLPLFGGGTEREWMLVGMLTPYDSVDGNGNVQGPNRVTVRYERTTEGGESLIQWVVSDAHGRVHTAVFERDPSGQSRVGQVRVVRLTAAHGQTAEWRFSYSPSTLFRCGDSWSSNDFMPVSRLDSVTTPAGTAYALEYNAPGGSTADCNSGAGLLRSLALPAAGTAQTRCAGASCGGIEWAYGAYQMPLATCDTRGSSLELTPGVVQRKVHRGSGSAAATWAYAPNLQSIAGSQRQRECVGGDGKNQWKLEHHRTYTNTVTDPTGDKTIHHFSAFPRQNYAEDVNRNDPNDHWEEFGLPFTRRQRPVGVDTLFLSTERQDCGGSGCTTVARTYVRYERDRSLYGPFDGSHDGYDQQQRLRDQRTHYPTANPHYVETLRSSFDGYGHYRVTTTQGGGWDAAGTPRTVTQQYNPGNGTYLLNELTGEPVLPGHTYSSRGNGGPWLLGLYTSMTTSQGGTSQKEQACFNAASGFLDRRRLFKNGVGAGQNDVIVAYQDTSGNVTRETFYGGDSTFVSTGDVCAANFSFPASSYALSRGYSGGLLSSTVWLNASGGSFLSRYSAAIDVGGARVLSTTEPDGITTGYSWDQMGRLTEVKPGQGQQGAFGAWTRYSYPNAAVSGCTAGNPAGTCAKVTIEQFASGFTGTALTRRRLVFDGLGRVVQDGVGLPGHTGYSEVVTTYDGLGQVTAATARHISPGPATSYDHDALGRVFKITPPDGGGHAIEIVYDGVRNQTRTARVARFTSAFPTSQGAPRPGIAELDTQSSSTFDAFGRVVRTVDHASGPAAEQLRTEYAYDVGDRLTSVTMSEQAQVSGNWTWVQRQSRGFRYDGLGRLRGENHPELLHADGSQERCGQGARAWDVVHDDYDPLGISHRRCDDRLDLILQHDRATRPTAARRYSADNSTACGQAAFGVCLKTFAYGSGASAADRSGGKLVQASSYTYRTDPYAGLNLFAGVQLTYDYVYDGRVATDGRASSRDLSMAFTTDPAGPLVASTERFSQSFSYNALGQPATVHYPDPVCGSNCSVGGVPRRTIALGYGEGLLTSVAGYAPSITYSGNGQVRRVGFWNGAIWQQDPDPTNLPRPRAICNGGADVHAACVGGLGPYAYDGAGNVKAVGGEVYAYDGHGRVVYGQVSTGQYQRYEFDLLGNVQRKIEGMATGSPATVADSTSLFTTTSMATNQLSGASYDSRGNMTGWSGNVYGYDEFDNLASIHSGGEHWWHFYDADGERVWSFHHPAYGSPGSRVDRWSLRGLDGQLLRELEPRNVNGLWTWHWTKDHVRRDGRPLAYETPLGRGRYFVDHLGSPRQVVAENGGVRAHHYYPFGEEIFFASGDAERIKFTGHERDLHDLGGQGDDLDYMHARHYSPITVRFLSVDPVLGQPGAAQSWNRYAYVSGNPLSLVDPDGRAGIGALADGLIRLGRWGAGKLPDTAPGRGAIELKEDLERALDLLDSRISAMDTTLDAMGAEVGPDWAAVADGALDLVGAAETVATGSVKSLGGVLSLAANVVPLTMDLVRGAHPAEAVVENVGLLPLFWSLTFGAPQPYVFLEEEITVCGDCDEQPEPDDENVHPR